MPPPGPPTRDGRAQDGENSQRSAAERANAPLVSLEIMFLSPVADRARLGQGTARLLVHLGELEVCRLPWNLFRSISTKAHLAQSLGPWHKIMQMPVGLNPGAFECIAKWIAGMMQSPAFFLIKGRDNIEEDIPLCRAARLLGLEDYAQHIFQHCWTLLDESLPTFEDLTKLEKAVVAEEKVGLVGYDGYLLFRHTCAHLARVIHANRVPDFEKWSEFFTAHIKIGLQVCEDVDRLEDNEQSTLKRCETEVNQAVAAEKTDFTAIPQVKPEEEVQSVTSSTACNVEGAEPDSAPPQQQPSSQSIAIARSPIGRSAQPHDTMYAHHGGRAAQPEMDLNERLMQNPWDPRNGARVSGVGMRANVAEFKPSQTTYQSQQPVLSSIGSPPVKERVDSTKQGKCPTWNRFGPSDQGPWNRKAAPESATPVNAPAVQAPMSPANAIQSPYNKALNKRPAKPAPVNNTLDTGGAELVALAKKLFPTPKDPKEAIGWFYTCVDALREQNERYREERYWASVDPNFETSNPNWKADWSHKVNASPVQQSLIPVAGAGYLHQAPQSLMQYSVADRGPGGFGQRKDKGSGNMGWNPNTGVIGGARHAGQDAGVIGHHRKSSSGDAGVIGHRRNTSSGDAGVRVSGGVGVGRLGPGVSFF